MSGEGTRPRIIVGVCREDNPRDVDETYGPGTYERLFPSKTKPRCTCEKPTPTAMGRCHNCFLPLSTAPNGDSDGREAGDVCEPRVVHCKREPFDVYIGRPGKWGNPFKLENEARRAMVIAEYRSWLLQRPQLVEDAKRELRGKVLGCWCAPKPCHGDVLLEIANQPEVNREPGRTRGGTKGDRG